MSVHKPRELVFARPVFAKEVMTEENEKKFDQLAPWQRHLVKRLIDHGDLKRAAEEAHVKTYVGKVVDFAEAEHRSVRQHLDLGGLGPAQLVEHLKECLEGTTVKVDKHGIPIKFTDMKIKLETLRTIFQLRGDFDTDKKPSKTSHQEVEELFATTDVGSASEDRQKGEA